MLYEQVDGSGSPHIRRDSGYKTPLAPISEVRKVTFAARFVQDELDNSYTPVDVVQVKFIPRFDEYRKSERRSMWYSNEDIKTMKQRAFRDIDVRRAEIRLNKYRQPSQQKKYSCDIRGLERLVYNDSNVCARIRYEALCALLQEQHRQRCWMYSVNNPGGIINPGEDFLDDERIRAVAIVKGESVLSQEIAHKLAEHDEADADLYLKRQKRPRKSINEKKDDRNDEDTVPSFAARQQYQQQQHQQYHDKVLSPIMGRNIESPANCKSSTATSDDGCCWCVGVVEKVGRSLLLHAMLTPFLKIQRGDALCAVN